tara:strand:- start:1035 stop:1388 length:354 start_codon:yes stop_codon:yes gene_type:complete
MSEGGQLQNFSVDQAAGAVVLILGAVASLLLVIWQSKCLCKINLCYIFQCERRPPSEDEMKGLKHQFEKAKADKEAKDKDDKLVKQKSDESLIPTKSIENKPDIENVKLKEQITEIP